MLLSFVVPEMILGVSLFLLFTNMLKNLVPLGTPAQILGLVTFQMSYPVIIVRARLLSIGPEYEEAAMDLGAKPGQSIRRVLLPLLSPAILASVAVTFADSVDDFVIVRYLSGPANSEPLSVKIYSAARVVAHAGRERCRHGDAGGHDGDDHRRIPDLPPVREGHGRRRRHGELHAAVAPRRIVPGPSARGGTATPRRARRSR